MGAGTGGEKPTYVSYRNERRLRSCKCNAEKTRVTRLLIDNKVRERSGNQSGANASRRIVKARPASRRD